MPTSFLSDDAWTRLERAARKSRKPAFVAVAYFADKTASFFPLKSGSRLAVEASDASVRSGRTCPAELLKLVNNGVRVFNAQNLHAKVFVFDDDAFVGSANASRHSRNVLVEGVIATDERKLVADARAFVRRQCLVELGPEALVRLHKVWKPPKLPRGSANVRAKRRKPHIELPVMRVAQLVPVDVPPEGRRALEEGRSEARKRMEKPRKHVLEELRWTGSFPFKRWEHLVQVTEEKRGRRFVTRPGRVVEIRRWSLRGRPEAWTYVEVPKGNRVELGRLARRLGRGSKKRLLRSGRVGHDLRRALLEAWST